MMIVVQVFLVLVGLLGLSFIWCGVIYDHTNGRFFKKLYHDFLLWHIPNKKKVHFNGLTISKCEVCRNLIILGRNGDWIGYFQYKEEEHDK
jgi:hypothetical protein